MALTTIRQDLFVRLIDRTAVEMVGEARMLAPPHRHRPLPPFGLRNVA